jgi:hypothetical protein
MLVQTPAQMSAYVSPMCANIPLMFRNSMPMLCLCYAYSVHFTGTEKRMFVDHTKTFIFGRFTASQQ